MRPARATIPVLQLSAFSPVIGIVVLVLTLSAPSVAQVPAACASADECRRMSQAALQTRDYEKAHDLAWMAYSKGPKQDPATLTLIARAQSLSGRSDDAYVMLRRLAEAGVDVPDVRESEDFQRVRADARWDELLALFDRVAANSRSDAGRAVVSNTKSAGSPPAATSPPALAPDTPAAKSLSAAGSREDSVAESKAASPTEMKAAEPPPSAEDVTPVGDDLALPPASLAPVAIAYDSVSARFVLGHAGSDALTVLSQTSTNAAAFTSPGWSGGAETTAVAIDRQAGDLWIALRGSDGSALHRLQLISGRRLEEFELPGKTPSDLTALAITREGVLALDRTGRRILRRPPRAKSLEVYATLPKETLPIGLAQSRTALYVAHAKGLLRLDPGNRRAQVVKAGNLEALTGWHSLAWHDGVLLGIRESPDGLTVLRARLNATGTAVTQLETLGPAASSAATLSDGVYYYLPAGQPVGTAVVRAIKAR